MSSENKQWFSLFTNDNSADVNIFGDISSDTWFENGVSVKQLAKQLAELDNVSNINVHINSYGGEVAEGLAIYNALRQHPAKITTKCEGMACSIASVIFMAGDERVMEDASVLMIHNAWSVAVGNADELRKQANDLDTINDASKRAYLSRVSIDEKQLSKLMDDETFLAPDEALEMGFATMINEYEADNANQSARQSIVNLLTARA